MWCHATCTTRNRLKLVPTGSATYDVTLRKWTLWRFSCWVWITVWRLADPELPGPNPDSARSVTTMIWWSVSWTETDICTKPLNIVTCLQASECLGLYLRAERSDMSPDTKKYGEVSIFGTSRSHDRRQQVRIPVKQFVRALKQRRTAKSKKKKYSTYAGPGR